MWPLKTILYFCLFWVGCLAALVNPIWGVVNYMMAYQTHPPVTWWGKPLLTMGMRFSLLAAGFTVVGLFLARRRVPVCRPMFSAWEGGVLLLLLIAMANVAFGVVFDASAEFAFEKFWKLQVFVLILSRLAISRRNLHLVIWTIVAGSLYLGYDAFTAPHDAFLLGRLEIFGGPDISTSSGASAHLASMLPIIAVAFLIARRWIWKTYAALAGALTFNAVVLCRTRSAFVGLLAGALVAVLMAPKARRFRVHAMLLLGGTMAFSLTDVHYWERMQTLFSKPALRADQAAMSRLDIWSAAARMLADYPTGVGLGNFSTMIGKYDPRYRHRSPHNTLVMCFCELGILGGLAFLLVIFESFRLLFRIRKLCELTDEPLETRIIIYGLMVSLVTYLVSGMGTERFSCESFWWTLVLPLCVYRTVVQEVWVRTHADAMEPEPALWSSAVSWEGLAYGR